MAETMKLPFPFSQIQFGYASAEVESQRAPDLLVKGYSDPHDVIRKATRGPECLFLGYKGSGKSAIAEHIRLKAETDPSLFAQVLYLSDFPYSDFKKVVPGSTELESKLPTAWKWLLLLTIFNSFINDQAGSFSVQDEIELRAMIKFLRTCGLYPVESLKQLALISSKKSFKAKIPGFLEGRLEYMSHAGKDLQVYQVLQLLWKVATSFQSTNRHVVIIDGLDDILSLREIQYQSLAALLLVVQRMNAEFNKAGIRVKIAVLCRTDLFERLPGANKNKMRQDLAVHLDWYHNPRDPGDSALRTLANIRARRSSPSIKDIFDYLPRKIDGRAAENFLFDLTRHTPRDFLQLLVSIQKFSKQGAVSRSQLLSGVRRYSLDYFLPEIKDELVGYLSPDHIEALFIAIGSLRSRHFYRKDLMEAAKLYTNLKPNVVLSGLRALFDCSAIGNVQHRPSGSAFYSFRYRNRNMALNLEEQVMLHRGVWKALNLV